MVVQGGETGRQSQGSGADRTCSSGEDSLTGAGTPAGLATTVHTSTEDPRRRRRCLLGALGSPSGDWPSEGAAKVTRRIPDEVEALSSS